MRTAVQRRNLGILGHHPTWFHHHGSKMHLELLDQQNRRLVISGSAAKVIIRKASSVYPNAKGWFVDWEVVQYRPYEEGVRGRSQFNDEDFKSAFGLSEKPGEFGHWLIQQFGASAAGQGQYIRWGNFLNIPCPGTGHDGDPNVSIYLDEEIQKAVRQLLE
ncbi:MAG: hypothetical protein A3F33_02715 [Candidatus Woykebacteria bacterium RIFCSPHIGHO2_12_FULL_43_10]|uniref:Uncharacterized protein n=1 Tax=Candidatus Woykebacteria bacterium RIFCSPHIGHO2_02_FULL_43_16b TaxID=1802601 RepID=A0A1G1WLF0_9BACT|nr:MAG: hypothetical protein A2802_01380 [Candidatus Woykebacteria bacterium RIFCSPHIGHO2_01_FULL_43_29]OGY28578.1 MAG: hypothetical protein A3J50_04085 [Candidatus Woykebacteria bacterium RIFCSPHIGHO2_02_FULL_43_16b]OGY28782.1 MAG: hypothetical protein A3F33_02715 [Candidatus Woykebacteria bacterium RIFCSPHIGHO2_12_FULL_43_10]